MPVCKGQYAEGTYYKGDEPSPKGLGYCARSEQVGKRRRGKDGEMWVVREDRIGRLSWKRVSSSSSSYNSPGTPRKKASRKVKNARGIKIPFDMCTKQEGLKLNEYINRHLVEELRAIPYVDYTLSWSTGWEYLLVQPRDKIHIFKRLIEVPKGQEGKTVLTLTGPECVQVMPRDPYQSIRTLIKTAPDILVGIFAAIIKELRAGKESFHNPNRDEVISMTTEGFGEGHMYFNLTPLPNAPAHVDHRFGAYTATEKYVDHRFDEVDTNPLMLLPAQPMEGKETLLRSIEQICYNDLDYITREKWSELPVETLRTIVMVLDKDMVSFLNYTNPEKQHCDLLESLYQHVEANPNATHPATRRPITSRQRRHIQEAYLALHGAHMKEAFPQGDSFSKATKSYYEY